MGARDLPALIRSELPGHAWRIIYLRYGCAAVLLLCTIILIQNMGAGLNPTPLYNLTAALVATNVLYSWHLLRAGHRTGIVPADAAARSLALQLGTDLFILTLVLHFSGGITNPFMVLYVCPVLLSGFLLSLRATYGFACWAALLYGGLLLLEYRGTIPHVPVPGLFPPAAYRNEPYLFVVLVAFALAVGLTAALSLMVSGRFRLQAVADAIEERAV